jgi:hypothetical protein
MSNVIPTRTAAAGEPDDRRVPLPHPQPAATRSPSARGTPALPTPATPSALPAAEPAAAEAAPAPGPLPFLRKPPSSGITTIDRPALGAGLPVAGAAAGLSPLERAARSPEGLRVWEGFYDPRERTVMRRIGDQETQTLRSGDVTRAQDTPATGVHQLDLRNEFVAVRAPIDARGQSTLGPTLGASHGQRVLVAEGLALQPQELQGAWGAVLAADGRVHDGASADRVQLPSVDGTRGYRVVLPLQTLPRRPTPG